MSFDAFFTHILMHELMHGLGPHNITVGGAATTVRQQLKETYSTIEEAKADVSGLWSLARLVDEKALDPAIGQTMYDDVPRLGLPVDRFGINEAHGRGIAIQMNYLLDRGAFLVNADHTFAVDQAKMADAVTALTREIMTLQAEGSYEKAKAHDQRSSAWSGRRSRPCSIGSSRCRSTSSRGSRRRGSTHRQGLKTRAPQNLSRAAGVTSDLRVGARSQPGLRGSRRAQVSAAAADNR